ncbi:unnamed protein product [Chrysodeixis includens]|uniref:Uncharacterized protein n=1 Tax=Chrysodeixis includens TaxID=689277 RepID=A0A9N8Q1C8_CHRIL|nr:unnamed protein product [Chrysodeixis includens]
MQALSRIIGSNCLALELIIFACKNKKRKMLQFLVGDSDLANLRNRNLDSAQQEQKMIEAFYHAMCDRDMTMVSMLYLYWREFPQSPRVNNLHLIRRLDNILNQAKAKCKLELVHNQNIKVKLQCLTKFINFQLSIYTRLNNSRPRNKVEVIRTVLKEYKNFKDIKNVRLPKETSDEDEKLAVSELSDDSTLNPQMFYHILYEEYYKKLDFFTALLVLDNMHIIKKKCKVQNTDIYQKIECTIFYYLWRVFENWTLYVPLDPSIQKKECNVKNNQIITRTTIDIDADKINNAPVIYLERQKFDKCLMNLLSNFNTQDYDDNNNILFDMSYLKHLPYMRDYYSLMKAVYYINVVENDTNIDVLCVQRALMVIGEMTKSSNESKHLSNEARALLEAGISVDTMQQLINIRNHIAKADEGKLSKRIEVASQHEPLFRNIQEELKEMNYHFKSVAKIYETILHETMVQHGLDLIEERIEQWRPDARTHMDHIYASSINLDKITDDELHARELYEELEKATGLTQNFVMEIDEMLRSRKILQDKLKILQDQCVQIAKRELPQYISYIKETLNEMKHLDAHKKKITIESVQNVLSFFSKMGAFDNPTNFTEITYNRLHSAEQGIYELINRIPHRINTGLNNMPIKKRKTFENIKKLDRLFITIKYYDLRQERLKLISDLRDRVDKLRTALRSGNDPDNQSPEHLWRKYTNNRKFRLLFEMLLSDIFNIFIECDMKNLFFKPDKLLTSINLRVVLAHGDPILEVLGDVLDPYDFPNALLSKALAIVEAGPCIEALENLYRQNINPEINMRLNFNQQRWVQIYRECNERDKYIKLININKKK